MELTKCKLGELITQRREKNDGSDLPICGVSKDGLIPPKQKDADTSIYNVFYRDDFIFNPARMELNSIAINDMYDRAICSSLYEVFYVHRTDLLLPHYLELIIRQKWFTRYCKFLGQGSAREYCRFGNISEIEIEFPPIEEQQKIVEYNTAIENRLALKQKINDNLVATLQIIYKKMFLESQNTYITKPLADLCSKIGSGATPKGGKAAYFDKGISLIRSMNVFDYFFSYPELAHISQIQANALANVEIQQADVLFNITGVSVTRCCVVPDDVLPARVNQHVMIIRPYKGKNMSYYIMCTLCTSENKAKLLGIGQSGSTREAINKQELERFEIPVPSDEELERFGEIATKIYALIFSNTNEIRMLCDMKDTLLTKLSSY